VGSQVIEVIFGGRRLDVVMALVSENVALHGVYTCRPTVATYRGRDRQTDRECVRVQMYA
jgi:hypothetical protein